MGVNGPRHDYGRHTAPGPSATVTHLVPAGQSWLPVLHGTSQDVNAGPAGPAIP
jgi:hypothetical protein